MTDGASTPLLSMRAVRKRYGSTVALDGVDLSVGAGEVHAVIGENGAGKSTLMNILCGVVAPDSGAITLAGAPYTPSGPAHALRHGLAMIHQELTLAPALTVEANILLGAEAKRAGVLLRRVNLGRARRALHQLRRADIDPDRPVSELGVGERQIVEIARALAVEAKIIVMDEPTSSLSGADRVNLFDAIRRLKAEGISLIYISHFLEEVEEICDRFTVLRDGKTVGAGEVRAVSQADLIGMMVGRKIEDVFPGGGREPGEPILAVTALRGKKRPTSASFELRRGEILGLAGLVGAGRTESLRAVFGLDPIVEGTVEILASDGSRATLDGGPRGRLRRGIGLLSEDRKSEGLAVGLSIAENVALSSPDSISRFGFIRAGELRRATERWIAGLSIRAAGPDAPAGSLSGGNQQKVAIARLLQQRADVFLLDEPTRGIDIGSKVEIYRLMDRLAREGKSILFVSSYLPELMGVCDRIGVMSRGELTDIRPTNEWTEHSVMAAATAGR